MDRKTDPRNLNVTTATPVDVKSTMQLKGEAKEGGAMKDKNELKEFVSTQPLGTGSSYGGLPS